MRREERHDEGGTKPVRVCRVDRNQTLLRVVDIEKLIPADHPARAIWEIVSRLDMRGFYEEIKAVEGNAGRPAYDPRMMICMWLYAYSEGVGHAREVGRLCTHDPAYQWITGCAEVNYHSLSDFRVAHKDALDELFIEVLGVLSTEGLVELKGVSHDGVKIKAFAGSDTFRREETLREHLKMAREQVERLSEQLNDEETQREKSARRRAARERVERVELAVRELERVRAKRKSAKENARVSMTEPESRIMKQADGGYAPSYNVQISTDTGAGIIVGVGVTNEGTDYGELVGAIEVVEENTGKLPGHVIADGGYTSRENIVAVDGKGVTLIGSLDDTNQVSAGQMSRRGIEPEFRPGAFNYDSAADTFLCPAGKILRQEGSERGRPGVTTYKYRARASDCGVCCNKNRCCPQNTAKGRGIVRRVNHPAVEAFMKRMKTDEAQEMYRQRGKWSEFVNAWIKEKFGLRKFHLRGMGKALIEILWACIAYNIKQWIRLRWSRRVAAATG